MLSDCVSQVRKNKSNGQKIVTIPKQSEIEEDEYVKIFALGKTWPDRNDYTKLKWLLSNYKELIEEANNAVEDYLLYTDTQKELERIVEQINLAEEKMDEAKELREEVQQNMCLHENVENEGEEWRCQKCGKEFTPK